MLLKASRFPEPISTHGLRYPVQRGFEILHAGGDREPDVSAHPECGPWYQRHSGVDDQMLGQLQVIP